MAVRCDRIQSMLPRLETGALPPAVATFVEEHLRACGACGGSWRERERRRNETMATRGQLSFVAVAGQPLAIARPAQGIAFETGLGWHALGWTSLGLALLSAAFPDRHAAQEALAAALPHTALAWQDAADGLGRRAAEKLRRYLDGSPVTFDEPVDLSALPPFQQQVLAITRTITYGETRTYGWIADRLGRRGAARAVGQALHRNPLAPIIPCHRVVGCDGELTGYAWGLPVKRWLLDMERSRRRLL